MMASLEGVQAAEPVLCLGAVMAFVARCSFCHLILREVPKHRLGSSVECPRCHNSFTLAEANDPGAVAAAQAPRAGPPDSSAATAAVAAVVAPPPAPPRTALADARAEAEAAVRERPAAEERDAPPRRPARRFPNYPGLASFLLGCFAFLAGAVLHAGLATLALGLFGLLLGVLGLCFSWVVPSRRTLAAVGLAVSLPALLVPLLAPNWLELSPIGARPKPANRGDAAVSLLNGAHEPRRPSEGETLWVDASRDALHHGDVRLRVSSALVATPEFVPQSGKGPPSERCLVIGLRVTNAGVLRNLNYTGWSGDDPAAEPPLLRDGQGKGYAPKALAGWVVKGRAPSATIPPGKTHDDVLVFEAPPRGAGPLRLELPASAVGADGRMRLEIPKQMIIFR
jgi:hypothetical protein